MAILRLKVIVKRGSLVHPGLLASELRQCAIASSMEVVVVALGECGLHGAERASRTTHYEFIGFS